MALGAELPPREKLCPMCREVKPAAEYYMNRAKPDHLASYCKRCTKQKAENNSWRRQEETERVVIPRHSNVTLEEIGDWT